MEAFVYYWTDKTTNKLKMSEARKRYWELKRSDKLLCK